MINALAPYFTPGLRCIDEGVLTAPAASVTFTGIDQHYRDLELHCQVRSDYANGQELDTVGLRFNNDSGANYDWMYKQAQASNVFTAGGGTGATEIRIARIEAANSRSDNFTPFIIQVQGYRFTDREKWVYCSNSGPFGDRSALADLFICDMRGAYRDATKAAITRIDLFPVNGANFVAGSRFTLYGIL
jgi:hypothetical protein